MEWYIPITILPGIGMLIMSTTTQMMNLSSEIKELLSVKCSPFQYSISDMKIKQLTRLTKSATLLYVSAACFVLSGIMRAAIPSMETDTIPYIILLIGVSFTFIALIFLVRYGIEMIKIRKMQHEHNHKL